MYFRLIYELRYQISVVRTLRRIYRNGWGANNINRLLDRRVRDSMKSTICHVLCSGPSLIENLNLIHDDHFVIGLSYSSVLPIRQDIMFIEGLSESLGRLPEQSLCAEAMRRNSDLFHGEVVCKDLWSSNMLRRDAVNMFGSGITGLVDIDLPPYDLYSQVGITEHCRISTAGQSKYVINQNSSALTVLTLAFKLGFTDIVFHGMDMRGSHFFHIDIDSVLDDGQLHELRKVIPPYEVHAVHEGNVWTNRRLVILVEQFKRKGMRCYSANDNVSTTYLPRCLML